MTVATQRVHGTCVALGSCAALLLGASGSGKSDLALRFVLEQPASLEPALVADDQVILAKEAGRLIARAPDSIAGKIEVRGLGILTLPHRAEAELRLVVHLVDRADVPRLPTLAPESASFLGVTLPALRLAAYDASAPLKLRLALQRL